MFLIRLFQQAAPAGHLENEQDFRRAIDEERMRVDRTGKHFAIVVFDCLDAAKRRQLATACRERLRLIDRTGLLSSREVALLLPGTDAAGARKVADEISSRIEGDGAPLSQGIYVYPGNAIAIDAGGSRDTVAAAVHTAEELLVEPTPLWKRLLDIAGASFGLLLASPVMLAAAIAIKLDSPGCIIFTQVRSGLGGQPFKIHKFRTMRVDAEALKHSLRENSEQDGPAFKIKDDPRITRVGRYLRRTCIDEFPQFWNVLKGDMSIVGPRPLPCDESEQCEDWQRRRLTVTPGLTCIWQVSGGMRIPFVEWMRMDIRYIRSRRLLHDLKLMWATLIAVIFHRASH
jgi:lipopolysaccharide/colanic/teichoic acid biosynthesis glycosyltransferase